MYIVGETESQQRYRPPVSDSQDARDYMWGDELFRLTRSDHRKFDVAPFALWESRLHQLQLVQVGDGPGRVVRQLGASNDGIAGHDLPVLLDQADDIRVVEAEHAGLGVLETDSALEFIPHKTPEAGAVELARGDGLQAQFPLQLDDILHGLLLDSREAGLLLGDALFADGLAGVEEVLGTQERPHMLGAEGRGSHDDCRWAES